MFEKSLSGLLVLFVSIPFILLAIFFFLICSLLFKACFPSTSSSQPSPTYQSTYSYNPSYTYHTPTPPIPTQTPRPTPGPEDMPEVGDYYWPTTRQLDTHAYLGLYSGEECRLENDTFYCTFNWYHQADTIDDVIVQTYKYNPQIWASYEEDRKNMNIVPHSTYDHSEEVKLDHERKRIQKEKERKAKLENAPDFCKYDYQDYYDMNADLFEDEDEVYDLFDAVCW